ncbi:LCP family protein [Actinotignum sanguinis]|uniref:LCP family glycopolymer transferase n=1 Tax=Actinotignum sanguinis TaxID=1445614 RepID=UPI002549E5CA|nr:LCP family protein [Actinotignum sanguinis]MDK7196706.1 LCP family protein [Actinotignum sanguinis]
MNRFHGATPPPSFPPKRKLPRPSSQGAQAVGRGRTVPPAAREHCADTPGATRAAGAPRRPAPVQPPSFAPQRQGAPARPAESFEQAPSYPPVVSYPPARPAAQAAPAAAHPLPGADRYPAPDTPGLGAPAGRTRRRHPWRWVAGIVVVLLILAVTWPAYLFFYGNSKLTRTDALSGAGATSGTTYLIVGSDVREADGIDDPTEGERADTIMLLHVPESGAPALVSLPRDSYVNVPGEGEQKLNSSFALGGPRLLVETVEELSGMTVDHYIQISMAGVQQIVDAAGGVRLCYDDDVDDADSGMVWEAGCHNTNGAQALAFARMRKSDPLGDLGRTNRQRQVVSSLISKLKTPATLVDFPLQRRMVGTAGSILTVDRDTSLYNVGRAGLALGSVLGEGGLAGVPPIADLDYRANGQSNVLLDPQRTPEFFRKMREGSLTPADMLPAF